VRFHKHFFRLAGLAALLALPACGDDGPPSVPIGSSNVRDLLSCDITRTDCQQAIYDSVAAMLGAEDFPRPSIRTISVEQHEQEVRAGLDLDDLTGDDATSRGLRLLGFIPEVSESLTATQAEYFITQIAAYYSRGSRSITIIDRDYEDVSAQTLLAHELTHAIQDNQFDLDVVGAGADTEDGVIGVRSVIEGDAMHTSFAWAYDKLGYLPEEIDWDAMHEERTAAEREVAADADVALIDSASGFPYTYGFRFMTAATLFGGLSARAAAFESPPGTTLEVMAGFDSALPAFAFPVAAHPAPLDGFALETENRFGAWYVYGFLRRRGLPDDTALPVALGWLGDTVGIYQSGSDVVAAVWRVQLADPLIALLLRNEVNADAADSAWSAIALDDEVFVLAAENTEALLAWAEQPLDSMTASIISKAERFWGGAVSSGNCLQSKNFSLPMPRRLLR
jgi:hypothetical protein